MRRFLPALLLALSSTALASEPNVEQLLAGTDDLTRGTSSESVMVMEVVTARYQRTVKMKAWTQGTEKSLIQILEPAKEAGISTLKVGENIWNYLPKVDRTMKIPAGMMSGAWMGSHITNDDLVQGTRLSDDYLFELAPQAPVAGQKTIRCTPKPKTPVVWGYVDVTVTDDGVPLEQVFYSEKGVKVRTMSYTDLKPVAGKMVPHRMRFTPHDKPGEFTEILIEKLELDVRLDERLFSLQSLRD